MGAAQHNQNNQSLIYKQSKPRSIIELQTYLEKSISSPPIDHYLFLLGNRDSTNSEKKLFGVQRAQEIQESQNKSQVLVNLQSYNGFVQIYELDNYATKSKLVFSGELKSGKRQDFGIQYNENGTQFYKGFFLNNKYHGWGITNMYKGEWQNGQKSGYGKYFNDPKYPTFSYEGQWKQNRFHGLGAKNLTISDMSKFLKSDYVQQSNNFVEDNPKQRQYQHYFGQWYQGQKFSCGKRIVCRKQSNNQSQEIYRGGFQKNVYQGNGKLQKKTALKEGGFKDELVKQGIFKQGEFVQN